MRNQRNLGSKALHVVRLLHEIAVGYEHRKVCVFMSRSLKATVQLLLNMLPNLVAVGTNNHRSLNGTVVYKLSLKHYVGIPLRKIHRHIGNFLYKLIVLLLFSHNSVLYKYK